MGKKSSLLLWKGDYILRIKTLQLIKNKNAAINKKIEEYDSVFYESVPVPVLVNYFL